MNWTFLYPHSEEMCGYLPSFLSEADPRSAKEQLNANYAHGGGWVPFEGFTLNYEAKPAFWRLAYPGDPATRILAYAKLCEETIAFFENAWVAIVQPDGNYEIARMD
jgi:hypothetical protein